MKKALAVLALSSMSMFGASVTGFIGDSMCGAKHKGGTEADAKCASGCIKKGDKAVLVTKDGKVYNIDAASQEKIASSIGKTVTVNGKVSGDTITVDSVK